MVPAQPALLPSPQGCLTPLTCLPSQDWLLHLHLARPISSTASDISKGRFLPLLSDNIRLSVPAWWGDRQIITMEGIKISQSGPDFSEISLCGNSSTFPSLHFEFPIPYFPYVFLLSPAWLDFLSPAINDASYLYTTFYAFKMFSSYFWSLPRPVSCQDSSWIPSAAQREMLPWRTWICLKSCCEWMTQPEQGLRLPACVPSHTGLHTPDLHPAGYKDLMAGFAGFTQQRVYFSLITWNLEQNHPRLIQQLHNVTRSQASLYFCSVTLGKSFSTPKYQLCIVGWRAKGKGQNDAWQLLLLWEAFLETLAQVLHLHLIG